MLDRLLPVQLEGERKPLFHATDLPIKNRLLFLNRVFDTLQDDCDMLVDFGVCVCVLCIFFSQFAPLSGVLAAEGAACHFQA